MFILQVPLIGVCLLACTLIRDRGLERPKEPEEIEAEKAAAALSDMQADHKTSATAISADIEKGEAVDAEKEGDGERR